MCAICQYQQFSDKTKMMLYKISELLRARSLIDSCVKMRVCKHGCDVLDLRVLLKILFLIKATEHFLLFT